MRREFEVYIDSILSTVLNTQVHENITSELKDHLESLMEEKTEKGMHEEQAVKESIAAMGDPKKLGKEFNKIYTIGKAPVVFMTILNIFSILIFIYMLLTKNNFRIVDYTMFLFVPLMTFVCLYFSIKYFIVLSKLSEKTIHFVQQKGKWTKSYIENLTNRIYVVGVGAFLILMIVLAIVDILNSGIKLLVSDNYIYIFQIVMYANLYFMVIINIKYPHLIALKEGIYIFVDIPKLIVWEDIDDFHWVPTLGKYRLDIYKNNRRKKIYGNFNNSEKIIIENILMNHEKYTN